MPAYYEWASCVRGRSGIPCSANEVEQSSLHDCFRDTADDPTRKLSIAIDCGERPKKLHLRYEFLLRKK